MRTFFLLAATAGVSALSTAQEVTVPEGFENTYTGNTSLLWRSSAFHFQCVYDTSHFVNQNLGHPIEITRLRFRPINGVVDPGGQIYTGVTIQLSSCPLDYDVLSTTFANNVGADVQTVFVGDVTVLPCNGGAPNDTHIDITLQTPFVYDPTPGLDLCVDVLAPNAPTGSVPNCAAASNRALQRARRNSTSNAAALTGGLSDFAAALRIDYNILPGTALTSQYGAGCYDQYDTFYETWLAGSFDLGGSAAAPNTVLMTPNSQGGFTVTPGTGAFFTPTTPDLALGDDALSAAQPLSFAFPYPGGNTNSIIVESNGNVWLQPPTHTSLTVSAGGPSLVSRGPVISAFYDDCDPSATGGGSVHFEEDITNGIAYVTWMNVPIWESAPVAPRPTNSFQVALFSNGTVELRYLDMDSSRSWTSTTVGFSPGANNRDPGPIDISASMPFSTAPDLAALALGAVGRPLTGSSFNLETTNIPATAGISATLLSFSQFDPGISLAGIGMPGCFQYAGQDVVHGIGFANPTISIPLAIPNNPIFVGVSIFSQSASAVAGVNALGFLTSNGLQIDVGNL